MPLLSSFAVPRAGVAAEFASGTVRGRAGAFGRVGARAPPGRINLRRWGVSCCLVSVKNRAMRSALYSAILIFIFAIAVAARGASISDFGAVPDDGKDDSNAIQAAIDASKSHDTIEFPAGVFEVGARLKLAAGRSYHGQAGNTILKKTAQADWIGQLQGGEGTSVEGITFDGGGLGAGEMMKNLSVTKCVFRDVTDKR